MRLIALTGFKGSGKSEVARHLVDNFGYERVSFADPLKAMLKAIGLTDEHLFGPLKETPLKLLCGETPRYVMQTLGTEWGRLLVHDRLWCNLWSIRAGKILAMNGNVVADDLRYPNEAETIRSLGGVIWRIHRNYHVGDDHISETLIDSIHYDAKFHNDGTLDELRAFVGDHG